MYHRVLIEGDLKIKIKNFSIPLLQAVIYSVGLRQLPVLLLPVFFST